jgi:hypothetical protein
MALFKEAGDGLPDASVYADLDHAAAGRHSRRLRRATVRRPAGAVAACVASWLRRGAARALRELIAARDPSGDCCRR